MPRRLSDLSVDASWTLFLDRDGVINRKFESGYIRSPDEIEFLPGALEAVAALSLRFSRIIVVTNQQGVGKGLMSAADLSDIHAKLVAEVSASGGRIDRIYSCTSPAEAGDPRRKPDTGMGLDAQRDFPGLRFDQSVMVGDSVSDMIFGRRLGMVTVLVGGKVLDDEKLASFRMSDLGAFARWIN